MKKNKEIGYDKRARFGWTNSFDQDPVWILEEKTKMAKHPTVVIPLPFISPKLRNSVREFTKSLWQ